MPDAERISAYLKSATERHVFPGCALGWVAGGDEGVIVSGRYAYDDNAPIVTERSLFDCASITKSIPVSSLAMWLIDRDVLSLDDRLIKYVPEYRGAYREMITIRHLLTHTLDFDFRLSEYKDLPAEELIDSILSVKMKSPPGEKFCYANATSIMLGMAIEAICQKPLHVIAKEVFFDPLGMDDTTFFPMGDDVARCVPTENDPWRGRTIQGEVHDESAWALRPIMTAGSAGMFSTVTDILKFIRMLVDGRKSKSKSKDKNQNQNQNQIQNQIQNHYMGVGLRPTFDGGKAPATPLSAQSQNHGVGDDTVLFSPEMIKAMYTNQIPNIQGQRTGLGWELNQEYMGKTRTATTFGKTGFTGCAVVIDKNRDAGLVLLSNYTYPTRKPNRDLINQVRSDIADMVLPATP